MKRARGSTRLFFRDRDVNRDDAQLRIYRPGRRVWARRVTALRLVESRRNGRAVLELVYRFGEGA